ncbi:MAG: hypothetical protein AAB458_00895 [Patescibacteria group bacterium]
MLFQTLRKIHERPLHERRRIAFLTALSLTFFVALLWFVTLAVRSDREPTQPTQPTTQSPFESLRKGFGEGFEALKNLFPN